MATTLVRVIAILPDGLGCTVTYPGEELRWPGESDADYYPRVLTYCQQQNGWAGMPFLDTTEDALPPAPQEEWRLVEGQLIVVALLPKETP